MLQIWSLCLCQDRIVGVMQMMYEKVNTVVTHLCQDWAVGFHADVWNGVRCAEMGYSAVMANDLWTMCEDGSEDFPADAVWQGVECGKWSLCHQIVPGRSSNCSCRYCLMKGYSVVMAESGCAISTCHDEAGIQANVRWGVYCGDSWKCLCHHASWWSGRYSGNVWQGAWCADGVCTTSWCQ